MKRVLLFCIVGLLCIGAVPFAAIAQINTFPAEGNVGIGTDMPSARLSLVSEPSPTFIVSWTELTGTVTATKGLVLVYGINTKFMTELKVGDEITIGTGPELYKVMYIANDTTLLIELPYYQGINGSGLKVFLRNVTNGQTTHLSIDDGDRNIVTLKSNALSAYMKINGFIGLGSPDYLHESINKLLCLRPDGYIGYCTTEISSSGECGCSGLVH